jgi:hypothetical protein
MGFFRKKRPLESTRPIITVIMFCKDRVNDHVIHPEFQREDQSVRVFVSWDDIQNWVANGYQVKIRPPELPEYNAWVKSRPQSKP